MKLAQFRTERGWTQEQAAGELSDFITSSEGVPTEVRQSQWSKWEKGVMPQAKSIERIERFTEGKVTLKDFVSEMGAMF